MRRWRHHPRRVSTPSLARDWRKRSPALRWSSMSRMRLPGRTTQFFEFVGSIAQLATEGQTVRLPPVLMQPIAADDVAAVMADVALAAPLNGTFDLAGPEPIRQDDLVRQFLTATGDARKVITDAS